MHNSLINNKYKIKLQTAKWSDYVVSCQHSKSKRVVLNFVFRKVGLIARIYGDNTGRYSGFIDTLPDSMVDVIEKSSSECKLCNSRCPKGYDFSIRGKHYFKCRYNCFGFPVTVDNLDFIQTFINNEAKERNA